LFILKKKQMDAVKVYENAEMIFQKIEAEKATGKKVGFVPTMGALHEGHLNLVKRAHEENDLVVVSIFVNPTQFNNPSDLATYPRMPENDYAVLASLGFDIHLFRPETSEVYPATDRFVSIDLGGLDAVLEGVYRPGHFQGVVHVVRNLFRLVNPDRAYFGRKDLQQLAVIRKMTEYYNFSIEIVACPTLRESSGLAMSSRNLRLSDSQRADARIIVDTLSQVTKWSKYNSPKQVQSMAKDFFSQGRLRLEYLELVDDLSFTPLSDSWSAHSSCCIAAYCGDVRLIDNMACRSDCP
jgi:pantoate--beta-alanine ligase